jgi:hypothetical protein
LHLDGAPGLMEWIHEQLAHYHVTLMGAMTDRSLFDDR